MHLATFGVNHQTAPLHLRERVVFQVDRMHAALTEFLDRRLAREALILSTCNRTEIYCVNDRDAGVMADAKQWLAAYHRVDAGTLMPHLYLLDQERAVRHAFRVAAGLDSMVVGEPQILGQMKDAARSAASAGTMGTCLHQLFQRSFSAAKEVRSQTAIGAQSVSMAAAAVRLSAQIFPSLTDTHVLLVGAGEMIELTATHFAASARWLSFGLPAMGSEGTNFVVAAALRPGFGGVLTANDTALLASSDGSVWNVFAREGDNAPVTPAGPRYATLLDPVANDIGQVAFIASLRGPGVTASNGAAVFAGLPGILQGPAQFGPPLQAVARLGDHPPDENGIATAAVWTRLTTCALPGGAGAGVVFLGETSGGDTTVTNKLALWAVDSHGTLRRLLRTGDQLTPGASPVTGITLLTALPGSYGATRSYNATGSLALLATFANHTQTLLRVDIP